MGLQDYTVILFRLKGNNSALRYIYNVNICSDAFDSHIKDLVELLERFYI